MSHIDYSPPNRKFGSYNVIKPLGRGTSGFALLISQTEESSLPVDLVLKRTHLPLEKEKQIDMVKRLQEQMKVLMRKDMMHINLLKHFGWDLQTENLIHYFLTFSEFCESKYLVFI